VDEQQTRANGLQTPLATAIARNVRRLRQGRGFTLEQLAAESRADTEAVRALEFGLGEPSLGFAWRLAHALGVPLSALTADQAPRGTVVMRHSKATVLVSDSQGLTSRALFPFPPEGRVEFFELHVAPEHAESCDPHSEGTVAILYVAQGRHLEVTVGREPGHRLETGDSILFPADLAHSYRNLGRMPAVLYLLITYRRDADMDEVPPSHVEPRAAALI
jgi:transcriptional regulator with XRE-family HTH domain